MESNEIFIKRVQDHDTGRMLANFEVDLILELLGTMQHVTDGWTLQLNEQVVWVDDIEDPTDIRDYGSGESVAYYHDDVLYVYADDIRDALSDDIERQNVRRISFFMQDDTMSANARSLIEMLYANAEITDFAIEDPDDVDGVVEMIHEAGRDKSILIMVLASPAIIVALALKRYSFVHVTDKDEYVELYAVDGGTGVQSCVAIV